MIILTPYFVLIYKDHISKACLFASQKRKTAEIAFEDRSPVIKDARLRECDYGDLTKHPSSEVDSAKVEHISIPFPNGESYEQTSERIKFFLQDLKKNYDNKRVMIIGHRATQYGLEYWIKGVSIKDAVTASWKWQPGWIYELKGL